jgi:hypothetical protein
VRASFPIVACKHSLLVHLDAVEAATAANPETTLATGESIFLVKSVKYL